MTPLSQRQRRLAAGSRIFGPPPPSGRPWIMVTPGRAGENPRHIEELIRAGVGIVRINAAFGSRSAWRAVAQNIRRGRRRTGKDCRLLLDLAGPKLRTSGIRGGLFLRSGMRVEVGVTLPGVIERLRRGDAVSFDDGRIEARFLRGRRDGIVVQVLSVAGGRGWLLNRKSINIPGRNPGLEALTPKDVRDLAAGVELADAIALSFVHAPADVAEVQERLRALGGEEIGVVVKIENGEALRKLGGLIRQAKGSTRAAILVARGDLGAEIGVERVPSAQREILRACRRAGIPSIIATGILTTMVEEGVPARGELIDAAVAAEADCIMLHGGPNVCAAVRLLGRICDNEANH